MSLPQTTPRPVQQQTALIRRPSLSAQQVELAQQSQGLPVIRGWFKEAVTKGSSAGYVFKHRTVIGVSQTWRNRPPTV